MTFANGVASFNVTLNTAGSDTITVVDPVDAKSVISSGITVVAALNHLAFTVAPPAIATAGVSFSVTVTAYSNSGTSVATSYTGPIKFTSSDSNAIFPTGTALNLTAGIGTFTITLKTAGNQTLSVADSSGTPTTSNATIAVSAAAGSVISAYSGGGQSAIIGNAFTNPLVMQSLDAYGNPVGGVTVNLVIPTNFPRRRVRVVPPSRSTR